MCSIPYLSVISYDKWGHDRTCYLYPWVEPLRDQKQDPPLYRSLEPRIGATITSSPYEKKIIGTLSFRYRATLGTIDSLSLLCSAWWTLMRIATSDYPFFPSMSWFPLLKALIPLSRWLIFFVVFAVALLHWIKRDTLDALWRSACLHSTVWNSKPFYFMMVNYYHSSPWHFEPHESKSISLWARLH